MATELQSLTALLKATAPSQAAQLDHLANQVEQAATEQAWTQAVDAYRTHLKGHVKVFVPAPVLKLPGVESLLDGLVIQTLNQAESEVADLTRQIELGPVGVALTMQPAILTNPFNNNTRRLLGIYPPTGLGVKFGTGPVSGGGSLDYQSTPNPRLSGSFGLKMGVFGVSALSILQDSGTAYALTTLIAARFAPGIQLGFGFAVSGVGGLIGMNRTTNVNELQARFRTGALADALFGDDPIRNATSTLQTLTQVYVEQTGSHVFGPTMQLSWLKIGTFTFFNVDLGVFMQLPHLRVDILASARAEVPLVFRLRMDAHGEVDPARQLIGVSAVLVDSHLMGIFRITGEAFFRLHYGDQPYVVLTIGGFFPGFNPAPAALPSHIQRIGMGLDLPVKQLYFRVEGYVAVTTNTLQFGGLLEAGLDVDLFSASGHLQLDAIFQFSPFKFEADFSAGFKIEVLGETFSGVRCDGKITGPGPFVIQARITYETPFFLPDIRWHDTFVFGQPRSEEPKVTNLLALLEPELTSLGNLQAASAEDRWVVLDSKATTDGMARLLAPKGNLVWSQQRTPLQLSVQRFEGALLAREWNLAVEPTLVAGETLGAAPTEQFSPGMFRQLSDAEKINLPKFEAHAAGLRLHFVDLLAPSSIDHTVEYEVHYEPPRTKSMAGSFFTYKHAVLGKLLSKHNAPIVANLDANVKIKPETWQVGSQTFTTHLAAHVAAQSTGGVAYLANDTIDLGGL